MTTITYRGQKYKISHGTRGGQFFVLQGKKHYVGGSNNNNNKTNTMIRQWNATDSRRAPPRYRWKDLAATPQEIERLAQSIYKRIKRRFRVDKEMCLSAVRNQLPSEMMAISNICLREYHDSYIQPRDIGMLHSIAYNIFDKWFVEDAIQNYTGSLSNDEDKKDLFYKIAVTAVIKALREQLWLTDM